MAWSWGHAQEAYEYAYKQLHKASKKNLVIIFAEWKWHFYEARIEQVEEKAWNEDRLTVDLPNKWREVYDHWLKKAAQLHKDVLADQIWEWASEAATCDNGGWNAWVCPDGCHTVPFGPKERS